MEVTWEQLGSPEKPGVVDVEDVGTVLITEDDLAFPNPTGFVAVLVSNQPETDWMIGSWSGREQMFFANPMIK